MSPAGPKARLVRRLGLLFLVLIGSLSGGLIGSAAGSGDIDSVLDGFEEAEEPTGAVRKGFDDAAGSADPSEELLEQSEDETESDEVLEGFDTKPVPLSSKTRPNWGQPLSLDGHLRLAATVNTAHQAPEAGETDWRGLSRLRGEGQLAGDVRLPADWRLYLSGSSFYDLAYAINGREDYAEEVLADYEAETELGESYLLGSLGRHLDLKAGRQIIVWGKSDNIRVTDLLNPLDLRSPGLTDVADLRLPVTATRLDLHGGPWTLTGAAVHEIRFNKLPSYGSDFYAFQGPPPKEEIPTDTPAHTEYALALAGTFRGWDLALSWADTYSDWGHLELDLTAPGNLVRKHERLQQFGLAANWALGNWLLKAEAARIEGLRFFNAPGERFGRLDFLLGIEYSGWHETTLSIEVADRHLLGYQERLKAFPDAVEAHEPQLVTRLSRDFWHDTLTLEVLASFWGKDWENGGLQRYSATYDINDALEFYLGFVAYQSGKRGQFQGVGDNDRLFAELSYHF
jgi:hypothetical protein